MMSKTIPVSIPDQGKIENNLSHMLETAGIANALKAEFIQNMEHDIRTPFHGIWMLASLLESKETDPSKKESLSDISKSAKELLDYCNGILEFIKAEEKSVPVLAKKFDLWRLIDKIVTMEIPAAKIKNLILLMNFSEEIPRVVIGDEHRLQRILINLVGNAIKFTHTGFVKISVKLAKKENKEIVLQIYIEDTGIGIPEDKMIYIYEKFTRINPASQGVYKGTGLGLRLVKQLIEEVDGEIDVKSEVGKGTTFVCTIPFKLPLVEGVF